MRFRFRAVIIVSAALLSACGGSSKKTEATCASTYWDGTVGTCLPTGWNALSHDEVIARGMPQEVRIAFQAVDTLSGQFPTVTVTHERLREEMKPADYSAASMELVARRKDYTKVDATDVTVDGQKVSLHVFSAQPLSEEPKQRFYQLATSAGTDGYVFTAALPLTAPEELVSQVKLILTKVTFQAPEEE